MYPSKLFYLSIEEEVTRENGKMPKNSSEKLFCCLCNVKKTAPAHCIGTVFLFICAAKPADRRLFGNVFFLLACIRLGVFGFLNISCELGDKALNCAFVGIGQLQICGEKLFTIGAKVVSLG